MRVSTLGAAQWRSDPASPHMLLQIQGEVTSHHCCCASRGGAGAAPKYSRLDAEVSAMQRNSSTYCDEPEDRAEYEAWLGSFDLAARRGDIDAIVKSNAFMAELQARIVPLIVQYEAFWTRYFYQ